MEKRPLFAVSVAIAGLCVWLLHVFRFPEFSLQSKVIDLQLRLQSSHWSKHKLCKQVGYILLGSHFNFINSNVRSVVMNWKTRIWKCCTCKTPTYRKIVPSKVRYTTTCRFCLFRRFPFKFKSNMYTTIHWIYIIQSHRSDTIVLMLVILCEVIV